MSMYGKLSGPDLRNIQPVERGPDESCPDCGKDPPQHKEDCLVLWQERTDTLVEFAAHTLQTLLQSPDLDPREALWDHLDRSKLTEECGILQEWVMGWLSETLEGTR